MGVPSGVLPSFVPKTESAGHRWACDRLCKQIFPFIYLHKKDSIMTVDVNEGRVSVADDGTPLVRLCADKEGMV